MASETASMNEQAAATAEEEGPPPIPSPEYQAAGGRVGDFLVDSCDFGAVDISAKEYAFSDLPTDAAAGPTVIGFTNAGNEFHELILVKLADGEERPLEELLALPDEEVDGLITDTAFAFAPPDTATTVTADLDPGRYVSICFVPVGITPAALESGAPLDDTDGHFMHGMVDEFRVA